MHGLREERGMALGLVLTAMVVIGVLIAAGVYMSTQDYRIAANTARETRAAAASELGLNRLINEWTLGSNTTLKAGDTLRRSYATNGGTATVLVTRLPGNFFWAVSEGYAGGMGKQVSARRRYGGLLRLNLPEMGFLGAVTTQGNITVSGNVVVNGNDALPTGWPSCGSTNPNMPGAAITPATVVTINGSVSVTGNPSSVRTSAAADTNTYFNYGAGTNYQSLAATANLTYAAGAQLTGLAPVVTAGVCTPGTSNWGDPNRVLPTAGACESYFPVIHALGDLKVTGGRGQGILLVDGDLTTAGGFVFTGAVIVRGSLKQSGTGNKITGAVMSASVQVDDDVSLSGNTSIQYSSCALMAVLAAAAYPKAARDRGWVDLF